MKNVEYIDIGEVRTRVSGRLHDDALLIVENYFNVLKAGAFEDVLHVVVRSVFEKEGPGQGAFRGFAVTLSIGNARASITTGDMISAYTFLGNQCAFNSIDRLFQSLLWKTVKSQVRV